MFYTYIYIRYREHQISNTMTAINRLFNFNFPSASPSVPNVSLSRYFTITSFALKSNHPLSNTIHMHDLSIRLLPSESNLPSTVQYISCSRKRSSRSPLASLHQGKNPNSLGETRTRRSFPEIIPLNRAAFNEGGGSEPKKKKRTKKHATTGNYIRRETSFEKHVSLSLSRESVS